MSAAGAAFEALRTWPSTYYRRTSEDSQRLHAPALLKQLGEIRREICQQRAPLNSPDREALTRIKSTVDDFAGLVTGDRKYFWLKPHGTPGRLPGDSEGKPCTE